MIGRPLSALKQRAAVEAGQTTPARLLAKAGEAIAALDDELKAFVALAPDASVAAAARAEGPLAGIALGVKDIYDTADMPTQYGSTLYRGHRPAADASLVAMARAKGAAILGKTATTEFASIDPAETVNPHDVARTPGGSSSGSAAAVAAGLVAGAFGTQTAGSIVRPAAFCGVAGYKPSFRLLPTIGVKCFSWSLDTAGLFAASVADVAFLAAAITGRELAVAPLADASGLRIGLYRSALDARLEPEMAAAREEAGRLLESAGASLVDVEEPEALSAALAAQPDVQDFEAAHALFHERMVGEAQLKPGVAAILRRGATITPQAYDAARSLARRGRKAATALFGDLDALLLPSAFGVAPLGLASTGDAAMSRVWTLAGTPGVNVPGFAASNGMPLGLSIVTRFGRDREALLVADLLERLAARR